MQLFVSPEKKYSKEPFTEYNDIIELWDENSTFPHAWQTPESTVLKTPLPRSKSGKKGMTQIFIHYWKKASSAYIQ